MMTVDEIKEHAGQLQGRLDAERRKVRAGQYCGHPHANMALIEALEGRVAELLYQCTALEARQEAARRRDELLALPTARELEERAVGLFAPAVA